MAPMYGQVVCGPPGSGKTTYCHGMQHYLELLGRNAAVINLDPANETGQFVPGTTADEETTRTTKNPQLPYTTIFDVCEEVVNLSAVMEQTGLGPNGGLIFCMEYLQHHVEDIITLLRERIQDYQASTSQQQQQQQQQPTYLIIDLPGQVELYTHSTCVFLILHQLAQQLDLRLTAVQLIDAHYCADPNKFLSAALLGTTTMIRLELPMVNVLSKVDLLSQFQDLPFALEFFTQCHDLHRLVPYLDGAFLPVTHDENDDLEYAEDPEYTRARQKTRQSRFFQKRAKLHLALAEVVQDFGLLGFLPLDITHGESVGRVLAKIDKCNGYLWATTTTNNNNNNNNPALDMFTCAVQDWQHGRVADIQERIEEQREWLQEQDKIRQELKKQQEQEEEEDPKPPNFPAARVAYVHSKKDKNPAKTTRQQR